MECLSPISIPRPNGYGNTDRIQVGCGKCFACGQKRALEWVTRIKREVTQCDDTVFVTLTYNNENLPTVGVSLVDVQKFLKKLRKRIEPAKIRYFLTSEYGPEGNRPHYHAIIFGISNEYYDTIEQSWDKGFITCAEVNDNRIAYVAGYCLSKDQYLDGTIKPFQVMSKNPGIGCNYVDKYKNYHVDNEKYYIQEKGGKKVALPRYYRNKIFDELTNKKISIQNRIAYEKYQREFEAQIEGSVELYKHELKKDYIRKKVNNLKKRKL